MTQTTGRTVHLGQFRLSRLQVVNWGTFSGYKDFPIDERGVLLTGPSGSGKSSLMDAHSLALLPTHDQRFNASADLTARGSKQNTRSVAAYVRGAWSETNDEHEQSKVRYLRGGKPTWSAVAATYEDGQGAVTTAVVVKWFSGVENDGAAMNTMHQLHDGHYELSDLNAWAERKFDTRWLKRTSVAVHFPGSQEAYLNELGKRIGLDRAGTALALMGKAKAMKNVGDLNMFIRDNMLDRPVTFDAAQRMLDTFTPLNEAYVTAERAAKQEKVLHDVPENWLVYQRSQHDRNMADALRGGPLERYVRGLHLAALRVELQAIKDTVAELEAVVEEQDRHRATTQEKLIGLETQLREKSEGLQLLEQRKQQLTGEARTAAERFDRYSGYVLRLGEPVPQDETAFREMRSHVPGLLASAQLSRADLEPRVHEAIGKQVTAKARHDDRDAELQRLRSARTLIPGTAVARRESIVRATGVPIADLPYAAELIDIADGEERWRPAAEKVLRGYGMRLLVPEARKDVVRRFIDSNDMRGLVEYSVVTAVSAHEPRPASNALAAKLAVDQEHRHGRWLAGQLAKQFDHVCVESADELDDHRIAVTVNGTVKLPGNHYRKDDRPELTNRASYILGANTASKRRALEEEVAALAEVMRATAEDAGKLSGRLDHEKGRIDAAREAAEYSSWSALDHWTPARNAHELGEQIKAIRSGDVDLQRLEGQRDDAQEEFMAAVSAWKETTDRIARESQRQTRLADLRHEQETKPHTVQDNERTYLDEVYASIDTPMSDANIGMVRKLLDSALVALVATAKKAQDLARERVHNAIADFVEKWKDSAPDDSGDVDLTGADFAALHTEIVTRRLPEAMDRLQRMISEDMVPSIAMLQRTIETAASEIEERIRWVNAGLRRVEFNVGTRLQIAYAANPSTDVKEFRVGVDELLRDSAVLKGDPDKHVTQFKRVKKLMAKFTADDAAAERWRRNVLDVRNGYAFYGREIDSDDVTVFTYRNTATNSGGEQEKLVAFCLAAALSYNLADPETDGRPRFGPLMLDEAFSKSDENFSAQALSAFDEFGFQLLIAAPIRMSGIVEPYIGQAILVEKRTYPDGARSTGQSATFGELAERRFAETDGEISASA